MITFSSASEAADYILTRDEVEVAAATDLTTRTGQVFPQGSLVIVGITNNAESSGGAMIDVTAENEPLTMSRGELVAFILRRYF